MNTCSLFIISVLTLLFVRPDNNLQDLRAKVFLHDHKKKKNGEVKAAGEATPSAYVPSKKEVRTQSIASIVISSPRVATNVEGRGQSSKRIARRKRRGTKFT